MNGPSILALALLAGLLLGMIFFGGLWWTIRKGMASSVAALWFTGSLMLRTAIAVAGFYFVSHGEWQRLVACLLGFLLARMIMTRLTRIPAEKRTRIMAEGAP